MLEKIIKIVVFAIAGIVGLFVIISMGKSGFAMDIETLNDLGASDPDKYQSVQKLFGTSLGLTKMLVWVTGIALVLGLIWSFVQDFKKGLYAVVGLVALLILFGIGYMVSGGDIPQIHVEKGTISMGGFKVVQAAIWMCSALIVIAGGSMLFDIVKGIMNGN